MAIIETQGQILQTFSAVIPNASTDSDILHVDSLSLVGIVIPVAHTGATLSLQGSIDGSSFFQLKEKDGTNIAITTAGTTGFYKLSPTISDGVPYIKAVSSSNESAQRTIIFVTAKYK